MNGKDRGHQTPVMLGCGYLLLSVVVLLLAVGRTAVGSSLTGPSASTTSTPRPTVSAVLGDPALGGQLFRTFQPAAGIACLTCHRVDSEARLVGPGLLNVARRAETRVKGVDAVHYLRESIVSPSAFVVEGYADIMPRNWGRVFSEKQVDDLIAYLLTLKGG